ncbi:MAG: HAD hydrolase family protein, partial [Gallionella sp.]|nr:HAD hydrolase family protein [Gallionella sp.]
ISHCVAARAQNLGISHVFQGVENKLKTMLDLLNKLKLPRDAAAYMGDDVVDLMVMRHVGLSISVPESPLLVREHSDYVTQCRGGHGAVREACELIMSAQGTLDAQLAPYLK